MALEFNFISVLILCTCVTARSLTSPGNTAPKGCDWILELSPHPPELEQVVLSCRLRTIGGVEKLLSNLTAPQIDRLTALRLACSDVLFFESSLEATRHRGGFLSPLRKLKDLTIEYCKIRRVPEAVMSTLRELRKLTLRSHNSDWSAMSLELHPDSFRGLSELRSLDLGDNNIWTIPSRLFCPLYSLTSLNLTENRLQDLLNLEFGESQSGCNSALEVLDLSYNDIIVLPDAGLSGLRSLQHLHLQENVISTVGDRAFVGLTELKTANLSSNSLIALPPELFQASRQLRELNLCNNSLSVLAPGIFEGLDRLEILDLSKNELTSQWVNRDTFTGLVRLVVLNLAHNSLTRIDSTLFRDLYSLQILNMEYNEIDFIADFAFAEMKNLHALTLTHNRLKRVNAEHFSGLYVLRMLFLDSNRIESIHPRSFENFTDLHELVLNGNHLGSVPEAVRKLHSLKTLDLGKNGIVNVNNSSFEGLEKLYGLRLVDNHIVNISRETFATLRSLEVLNLATNKISHVEQSAFAGNPILKLIRLDGNKLTDISGVFTNLHSLVWLNVSDNHIMWFDFSHLPKNLEWLDMRDNKIPVLGNYYEVSNSLKIKMLDASFNQLTAIDESSVPDSVETLFLNNNKIKSVSPGTFLKKHYLDKVVLYGNEIRDLELAALGLSPVPDDRDLPQFYIGGNPFHCDCNMEWLQRVNQLSRLRQYPRVLDLEAVTCSLTHNRGAAVQPLLELKPSDFLCPYETHCFATCHCCDFDACDCEMTCPNNCTCYYDLTWTSNVVDCSNAGYTQVPERIPMDATEIYLDGNDLGELGSHVFIGKKKLEVLFLNNSNIHAVHNRTFNGVKSLRILHMENNQLDELRGFEFDQLENLNELYLEHNSIETVGNTTFKNMHKLEVLKLDDNKITDFSPWQKLPDTTAQVSLNGNQWSCDCHNVAKLTEWLRQHAGDPDKLLCSESGDSIADAIRRCEEGQDNAIATSVIQREMNLNEHFMGTAFVPLLAATLVALIVVCLLFSVAYVFRQDVRLWAHSKYGIRLFGYRSGGGETDSERDRLYDGYVVYSMKDDDLVSRKIAPVLEQSGYTMCLHYRDLHLVPGASYLGDSILSAADSSRRIVLIISHSFLVFEWSRPELRAALLASLRGHRRRHKLVCILIDGALPPAPDSDLRALLNAATPLVWSDRRFWEKLRYAMPDVSIPTPRKLHQGNCKIPPTAHGARYTAAPTALDSWHRYNIAAAVAQHSVPSSGVPQLPGAGQHQGATTPTPTQSTYVSGDEAEGSTASSSQHYECAEHGYMAIPSQHPHVYSTIPDTRSQTNGPQNRTYFV